MQTLYAYLNSNSQAEEIRFINLKNHLGQHLLFVSIEIQIGRPFLMLNINFTKYIFVD